MLDRYVAFEHRPYFATYPDLEVLHSFGLAAYKLKAQTQEGTPVKISLQLNLLQSLALS
jgi:hypothetical protein